MTICETRARGRSQLRFKGAVRQSILEPSKARGTPLRARTGGEKGCLKSFSVLVTSLKSTKGAGERPDLANSFLSDQVNDNFESRGFS